MTFTFIAAVKTGLIDSQQVKQLQQSTEGGIPSRLRSVSDQRYADQQTLERRIAKLWREVAQPRSEYIEN